MPKTYLSLNSMGDKGFIITSLACVTPETNKNICNSFKLFLFFLFATFTPRGVATRLHFNI